MIGVMLGRRASRPDGGSIGGRPLRVLAAPPGDPDGTAAIYLLYAALDDLGVEVRAGFTFAHLTGVDICHLHFPEYAAMADRPIRRAADVGLFFGKLLLLKLFGVKLIWTVHNLYPHDLLPRRSMRLFYFVLFQLLDGLIFLSRSSRTLCYGRYREARRLPASVVPSAHFRSLYAPFSDGAACAVPRNPDTLLFFGMIRPYKGLDQLVSAFGRCRGDHLRLVCAGAAYAEAPYMVEIGRLAAQDARVDLRIGWVSRSETVALFRATALVVLPYRHFFNSGVAMIAVSLDRPVLVPASPCSLELQQQVGSDWVMTYEGELTPEVLVRGLAWARSARAGSPHLVDFERDVIARDTLAFYHRVRRSQATSAAPPAE